MPSLFKALGAVLCLIVALCFAAPNAVADEFVYTVTETGSNTTQFSFIEPTLASSGTVDSGLMQIDGATATAFAWDSAATGRCFAVGFGGFACAGIEFVGGALDISSFSAGSFLAPGTFKGGNITVNIAQTGVPEPSSVALMLSGVGLVFAMRKRWASGLQQAS